MIACRATYDCLSFQGLFKFCPDQMTNPTIEKHAIGWARNAFTLLAMMDYPYPTNFMVPLPGNPVNLACTMMSEAGTAIEGLANVTSKWSKFVEFQF